MMERWAQHTQQSQKELTNGKHFLRALTLFSVVPRAHLSTVDSDPDVPPVRRSCANNLTYEGGFRFPQGKIGGSQFSYGGTALGFNSATGSWTSSDTIISSRWPRAACRRSGAGHRYRALATAMVLQPFTDDRITRAGWTNAVKIGGAALSWPVVPRSRLLRHDYWWTVVVTLLPFKPGRARDLKGPYKVGTVGAGFVSATDWFRSW